MKDLRESKVRAIRAQSDFAKALRALLDDSTDFSRDDWASFLGISTAAISQWVQDKTLPKPENLRRLIRYLKTTDGVAHDLVENFERLILLPAKQITPLADRIGDDRTIAIYMLRPIREAFLKSLAREHPTTQEKILLRGAQYCRGVDETNFDHRLASSFADQLMENISSQINFSSSCFYIRDPMIANTFRLIAMRGVRYTEAMHGLLSPQKIGNLDKVTFGQSYLVVDKEKKLQTPHYWKENSTVNLIKKNRLYGSFIERESVHSYVRCQHVIDGNVEATLFLNFDDHRVIDSEENSLIGDFFDRLIELLPEIRNEVIQAELDSTSAYPQPDLHRLVIQEEQSGPDLLNNALSAFLDHVLQVFELDRNETLASIHIFDEDENLLRLAAIISDPPLQWKPTVMHLTEGEGLISWAGIHKRPILVNDLVSSEFRHVYKALRGDVKSELSIPMIIGRKLVGVLNIESPHLNVFNPELIGLVWGTANYMALVWDHYVLEKQVAIQSILSNEMDMISHPQGVLRMLAEIAGRYLHSARVDIWKYDNEKGVFTVAGANYGEFVSTSPPRRCGWSEYITRERKPLYISNIDGPNTFRAHEWDGFQWERVKEKSPSIINSKAISLGVLSELGLPLLVDEQCVGVLWLKFNEMCEYEFPLPNTLHNLEMYAGDAGRRLVELRVA